MLVNDLQTRAHMDTLIIEADYREEVQYDDGYDIELDADTERRQRIADQKGMTLEAYNEFLADRRDGMLADMIAHRKHGFNGRYTVS